MGPAPAGSPGATSVHLGWLIRIAGALGVDLADLVQEPRPPR
ncbi:hypothetical protein [Streptomyces johnsoniae]|uniref:XRE family transcriptional regulator n=1 Tax=Streptomyces johnsoniae TaxID=3075532 RepID=A0ABU2RWS3_9ACTN|nr:hypothetical protein [Streptomyces sp. DSM 41886]MDT0441201.1 hypothetical protein [Streptomyces sp. DSM 41886]